MLPLWPFDDLFFILNYIEIKVNMAFSSSMRITDGQAVSVYTYRGWTVIHVASRRCESILRVECFGQHTAVPFKNFKETAEFPSDMVEIDSHPLHFESLNSCPAFLYMTNRMLL
jgi:hypothetical protein